MTAAGNCYGRAREWGAGQGPADLDVAMEGCRTCPILDGCVDRFAVTIGRADMPALAGLVLGGLTGRELVHAVKVARVRGRAA